MARDFNGTDQYATAASSSIYNSTDVSISLWVYVPTGNSASYAPAIATGGWNTTVFTGLSLDTQTSGDQIYAQVWEAGNWFTQAGDTYTIVRDTWVHHCITARLTTSELNRYYTGGVQEGADLTSGSRTAGARPLFIGGDLDSATPLFDGLIAEVSIYNTDLTSTEVTALANGDSPLSGTLVDSCVAYWRMDGSGATEDDLVSSITLTYTGSPGTGTGPTVDDPPVASGGAASLIGSNLINSGTGR